MNQIKIIDLSLVELYYPKTAKKKLFGDIDCKWYFGLEQKFKFHCFIISRTYILKKTSIFRKSNTINTFQSFHFDRENSYSRCVRTKL